MLFERVDHDDRASLSPPALAALGRVLRRIHAIAGTPDLEAAVGRQTAPEAMLERVQTRVSALAEWVGYSESDELLSRAQMVIGERAGLRDLCLTHMDVRPENLVACGVWTTAWVASESRWAGPSLAVPSGVVPVRGAVAE